MCRLSSQLLILAVLLGTGTAQATDNTAATEADKERARAFAADLRVFVKEARALAELATSLPAPKDLDGQMKKVESAFDKLAVPKYPGPVVQQAMANLYKASAEVLAKCHRQRERVALAREASRLGDTP
jgi:hypothetical protein